MVNSIRNKATMYFSNTFITRRIILHLVYKSESIFNLKNTYLISAKNIPCINFLLHFIQTSIISIRYNHLTLFHKLRKVIHHLTTQNVLPSSKVGS